MDPVATILFERQLRGLGIYGHTVESQRDGVRALMHPAVAAELDRFLKINPLPTPAQNPVHYKQVFELFQESQRVAGSLGVGLKNPPVLGTEMAGELNGFAFSPDGEHYGIILDEHLFTFIYLSAKFVVQLCSDSDADSLRFTFWRPDPAAHLRDRSDAVERLVELVLSYLGTGNASAAPPYRIPDLATRAATDMTYGAELFCVAHECGHIYHGHVSGLDRGQVDSMRREVAADQYGVQLTMAALNGRPEASRQMGICGMFVFFIALELLERSVIYADCHADLLGDDDATSGYLFRFARDPLTHPHPFWRRHVLLTWIGKNYPALEDQCRRMDEAIANWFLSVQGDVQKRIDVALANGLTLHRRWDSVLVDIEALRAHGRDVKAGRAKMPDAGNMPNAGKASRWKRIAGWFSRSN
jgi:hypothetical protein